MNRAIVFDRRRIRPACPRPKIGGRLHLSWHSGDALSGACLEMPLYLDACAVVKRYIDEYDGATPKLDAIMGHPADWGGLSSSEWLLAEVVSTFGKKLRNGLIKQAQYRKLLSDFQIEARKSITLVEVESDQVDQACSLLVSFSSAKLHSGDALHLHVAELIRQGLGPGKPFVVVTADEGMEAAAARLGIPTYHPVKQPLSDLQSYF